MNTFDEIIQTKAYSDLTSGELEVIRELISSEEEYNEMKSFYSGIDQLAISSREEVSPSVKNSLNSVFQSKHPGISQNWSAPVETEEKKVIPLYNRTLFRVAAILVLSAGAATLWFAGSDNQLEKSETVQLTANTDTVSDETAPAPKKEFPIDDTEQQKDFTAASKIPSDKNVDQHNYNVYSNATTAVAEDPLKPSWTIQPQSFKNQKPAAKGSISTGSVSNGFAAGSGTYSVTFNPSATNGIISSGSAGNTYYFSSSRTPNKAAEKRKKELYKDGESNESGTLLRAGVDADLHPGGFYGETAQKDYKQSISTNELLTLIEPSF